MSRIEELIEKLCPEGVEYLELGKVCDFMTGFAFKASSYSDTGLPICKTTNIQNNEISFDSMDCVKIQDYADNLEKFIIKPQNIVIGMSGTIKVGINNTEKVCYLNQRVGKFSPNEKIIKNKYLYYILCNSIDRLIEGISGGSVKNLSNKDVLSLQIPIPPLEVQSEIVKVLDNFSELAAELAAELTARKQQYEYYRDSLLTFSKDDSSVEWKHLQDVILSLNTGLNPRQFFKLNTDDATNYYVTIREIHNHRIVFNEKTDRLNDEALKLCNNRSNLEVGDVLFSGTGTIGETALIEEHPTNWNIKEGVYTIKPNQKLIIPKYLLYILDTSETKARYMKKASGGTVKSVSMVEMRKLILPIPPIERQKQIVEILDNFSKLCEDISEGLPAEIEARQKQYEYYRDKLLTFKELKS